MPVRAVTFDFHNTIARCDRWFELEVRELVPSVLAWHGHSTSATYSPELCQRAVAAYRALRLEIIQHGEERDATQSTIHVLNVLGISLPEEVVEEGIDAVMRETLDDSQAIPGVVESVMQLADQGIRLGVVSSAVFHPFLEWSLDKFGIRDCFDSVITSASAGFYKSRPEIYEHALELLAVEPGETVHVGDSYRWDVQMARRVGMGTVWYRDGHAGEDGADADIIVDTLHGVAPQILDRFGVSG